MELLGAFQASAADMLLFLRSVERIELAIWRPAMPAPAILHTAALARPDKEMRKARAMMLRLPALPTIKAHGEFVTQVNLEIETASFTESDRSPRTQRLRWLVVQGLLGLSDA